MQAGIEGLNGNKTVPPPIPPDDPEAWYAPTVCEQYEVYPGVVTTIRQTHTNGERGMDADTEFTYEVREPQLTETSAAALKRVIEYFSAVRPERPLTREGAVERMQTGFAPKYGRVIDRLIDLSPAARRRFDYHTLARIHCFETLTPHALDDRIEVADWSDGELIVHTRDYAPAMTGIEETSYWNRFASERVRRYTVPFLDFEIPVVVYRERVLGTDPFTTKYAVCEPDLLPGDADLIDECKERIWETNVDSFLVSEADSKVDEDTSGGTESEAVENRIAFVRERSETLLSRQLTARNTRAWIDSTRYQAHVALAEYEIIVPPISDRFDSGRLSDLVYYVLRDYVGHGQLTIPIRDGWLEDIEANRVGDRVKVVPRGVEERVPTNLVFEDEDEFVNVVTQLAAADGVELNASTPSAKVNIDPVDVMGKSTDETIRCAVALPIISEDGPHISIRKQSPDPLTPIDLVRNESIPTEFVALLWLLFEYHGVVLFSGPTGVGKTTLMNAHIPFIPHDDRPISIDEGSREVRLPHETGVSLKTRDHQEAYKRVTMADLMTESNYLNPDIEVIAEINTPESFATFGEIMSTGHGIIGTTHAETMERLVNRVIEQGLPSYLLSEIDLVVFPRHVNGERYVGEVVELVSEPNARTGSGTEASAADVTTIERGGATVHYNTIIQRTDSEFTFAYDHPVLGDRMRDARMQLFEQLADRTDQSIEDVETSFHRKHRYVEYLVQERVTDIHELFMFLANLGAEETATVERESRQREISVSQEREDTGIDPGKDNDDGRVRGGNGVDQERGDNGDE
jgi:type IV secretory pathway ATPase VirB11/archaellum biosynthesis ATPase